ncbi:MAG: metallophosphoesterase family protein [Armatimonadetes bacterium]|nr:metallophosphoesterase family protein [Armatimonadota bacterium]
MGLSATVILVAVVACGLLALELISRSERGRLRVTHLQIQLPRLHPDLAGFRIVFLTDIHLPFLYVSRDALLETLAGLRPDLVLLGGDYAGTRFRLEEAAELVGDIARRLPTVGVCGNTERYFPWDLEDLRARLRAGGGDLLSNDVWSTSHGSAVVEVIGLDEPIHARVDVEAALARSNPDADLRVGLAHSPAVWQDIPRLKAHITLCGHTHGGQVRLPGMEALVTHWNYPREMASGLFRLRVGPEPEFERLADHWQVLRADEPVTAAAGDGALMYVSRGLGVTPPKLRVMCPPEIVCVEFVAGAADAEERTTER